MKEVQTLAAETQKTINVLKKGGVIVYPTSTIWGIGCSAYEVEAIKRIYQIKNREDSKSLIILVDTLERLEKHIGKIPQVVLDTLANTQRPTSIIYPQAQNLPDALIAENGSIAIRLTQSVFCQQLIAGMDAPLVSTSANVSGEASPQSFADISPVILQGVDYVVEASLFEGQEKTGQASQILRLLPDHSFEVIRA